MSIRETTIARVLFVHTSCKLQMWLLQGTVHISSPTRILCLARIHIAMGGTIHWVIVHLYPSVEEMRGCIGCVFTAQACQWAPASLCLNILRSLLFQPLSYLLKLQSRRPCGFHAVRVHLVLADFDLAWRLVAGSMVLPTYLILEIQKYYVKNPYAFETDFDPSR